LRPRRRRLAERLRLLDRGGGRLARLPPPARLLHRGAAEHPRRGDRRLHPGLHHLDQRRLDLDLPHRPRRLDPADPDPRPYGTVLRPSDRLGLGGADAGDGGGHGGGRGDAGPDLPDQMTVSLTLSGVSAHYGSTRVLEDLALHDAEGELVSLRGASGCGKTTTLRLVAGFLQPTTGSIRLGERDLTRLPAHARNIGLVFQTY